MSFFTRLLRKREDIIRQRKANRAVKNMRKLLDEQERLWKEGTLILGDMLRDIYRNDPQKPKALSGHLKENGGKK